MWNMETTGVQHINSRQSSSRGLLRSTVNLQGRRVQLDANTVRSTSRSSAKTRSYRTHGKMPKQQLQETKQKNRGDCLQSLPGTSKQSWSTTISAQGHNSTVQSATTESCGRKVPVMDVSYIRDKRGDLRSLEDSHQTDFSPYHGIPPTFAKVGKRVSQKQLQKYKLMFHDTSTALKAAQRDLGQQEPWLQRDEQTGKTPTRDKLYLPPLKSKTNAHMMVYAAQWGTSQPKAVRDVSMICAKGPGRKIPSSSILQISSTTQNQTLNQSLYPLHSTIDPMMSSLVVEDMTSSYEDEDSTLTNTFMRPADCDRTRGGVGDLAFGTSRKFRKRQPLDDSPKKTILCMKLPAIKPKISFPKLLSKFTSNKENVPK